MTLNSRGLPMGSPDSEAINKTIRRITETTAATCARPGCPNPPRPSKDPTRKPPIYCSNACKTRAFRERKKAATNGDSDET